MADLNEAFNTLKTTKNVFHNIDYFFTQRNMTEEQEYLDKNMNRKTKKVKITCNFLALNIPTIETNDNKLLGFDIEIFGDEGYRYKGTILSFNGIIPNLMIPLSGDKKIFVNIKYKYLDNVDSALCKEYVNFIEVPKRFIQSNDNDTELNELIN